MNKWINLLILLVVILNLSVVFSYARIIKASSCSQADVKTAINSSNDGDIIVVPEDTATWSTALIIDNLPSVTIKGAGNNKTMILDATPVDGTESAPLMITVKEDKPFRISGFTFKGVAGVKGMIFIDGASNCFRIDNCIFIRNQPTSVGKRALNFRGPLYGVVDHCRLISTSISVCDNKDESWTREYVFGSAGALYMENNSFEYTKKDNMYGMISGHYGCRWVLRFNYITYGALNNHGTCTSPRSG